MTSSLTDIDVFSTLSDEAVEQLHSIAEVSTYEAGALIIAKGHEGTALYALSAGRAAATVPNQVGDLFDDAMGPGDVFGEMALLTGAPRSADVRALTDCTLWRFDFKALREVMNAHPKVAQLLTNLVGVRLTGRHAINTVGDYIIESPMGRGGFSTVFRARHAETGEPVAVKMLKHELVWRSDFAERFRSEARIIQRLVHPNIVRVHAVIEAYATIFLVMEMVDGVDLGRLITARGSLSPAEVRYVTRRVCAALHHAHSRQVIHRDVKPANILLTKDGDVKLVDFGIALGPDDTRRGKNFYGTPHYAAPEHIMHFPVDGRSDIYMLGITVYELITGEIPYADDTVQTVLAKHVRNSIPPLAESVPADLRAFVQTATERRPRRRFANCETAATTLDAAESIDALPQSRPRSWDDMTFRETLSHLREDSSTRTEERRHTAPAQRVDITCVDLAGEGDVDIRETDLPE